MQDMKIVIIDDDANRREQIKKSMPGYAETVSCGFGNVAINQLKPDSEGVIPDIVIMNADDSKGMGLYTFDWMKTKSGDIRVMDIPVILLTEDEFSDRCMEFLEIDDAEFYEGEVDEDAIYSKVMEVIKRGEFEEEAREPVYSSDKSYDRISGMSVRPQGETMDNKRSAVLDMDRQLQNLEMALERGRQKEQQIKRLFDEALGIKENKKPAKEYVHIFNKIRVEKGMEPVTEDPLLKGLEAIEDNPKTEVRSPGEKINYYSEVDEDDLPEEFRMPSHKTSEATKNNMKADAEAVEKLRALRDKLKKQPSQTTAGQNTNGSNNASFAIRNNLKTIVVVDDDENDRQLCELFLSKRYNVITLDSGMKAIDYFVKNSADLILLDTYMPNLGGVQTLYSVRYQANGSKVPVIYMIDKRYPVSAASLAGDYIAGIVQKPLTAGGLAIAIDGYFRRAGR